MLYFILYECIDVHVAMYNCAYTHTFWYSGSQMEFKLRCRNSEYGASFNSSTNLGVVAKTALLAALVLACPHLASVV